MVQRLRWMILSLALFLPSLAHAQTATVTWGTTYQTIQGFGAGNNYIGAAMNPYDSFLIGTLGYSSLRMSIPLGTSCNSVSSGCATGQDSVTDAQAMVASGGQVWAYNNQCTIANYTTYATQASNFIASLANFESVSLASVSVLNEPDIGSCVQGVVASGSDVDTIVRNFGSALSSAGQSTLIMMPESSLYSSLTSVAGTCAGDSGCFNLVGVVAYHGYDAPSSPTDPYSNPPVMWETEASAGPGYGPNAPGCSGGQWCPTIADALMWAGLVDDAMAAGNSAYHYFWFVDPDNGFDGCNTCNFALINPTESTPISIRAYAIAQWAKFVRPGWVRIDVTHNPLGGVTCTAFKDPGGSGNFAIVCPNQNGSSQGMTYNFSGFTAPSVTPYITDSTRTVTAQTPITAGSSFSTTLAADSVTTFFGTSGAPPPPTSTFYASTSSGSDSNPGTKTSPWYHIPGMTGVTGVPAAHTIAAGDSYILKGGDTWPAAAFPMQQVFTGSSSSTSPVGCAGSGCIYIGVDQTWFTGGSWTRPIFNGGNTQVGTYPGGIQSVIDLYGGYFVLDNIEFTGWWQTVNTASTWSVIALRSNQSELENNYIHGWGHGGTATLDDARFISTGVSCPPDMTSSIHSNVEDGADTTGDMGFGMGSGVGYVYDNYVADTPTLMFGSSRYWFGNTLINSGPGHFDPGSHGNVIESSGCQMIAFNNYSNGAYLGSSFFNTPVDGSVDYDFNNVLVNQDGVQAIQVDGDGLSTGAGSGIYIFNNILQQGAAQGGNPISLPSRGGTLPFATIYNNFLIATNPTVNVGSHTTTVTQSNQLGVTNATAASDGYTFSGAYPFLSPNSSSPTVATGQTASTMNAICAGIPSTALAPAAAACQSDSAVGVGYRTTNHTVIVPNRTALPRPGSGPWDIGAYQFSSTPPPPPSAPSPPTGLKGVPF